MPAHVPDALQLGTSGIGTTLRLYFNHTTESAITLNQLLALPQSQQDFAVRHFSGEFPPPTSRQAGRRLPSTNASRISAYPSVLVRAEQHAPWPDPGSRSARPHVPLQLSATIGQAELCSAECRRLALSLQTLTQNNSQPLAFTNTLNFFFSFPYPSAPSPSYCSVEINQDESVLSPLPSRRAIVVLLKALFMLKGFLAATLLALVSGLRKIKIDPSTRRYVDASDRAMTFHGMNAVYKKTPWHTQKQISSTQPIHSLTRTPSTFPLGGSTSCD